ncbi:indolepyruvate ferredoxin oxidoreductase family protein [Coralliovum pocilloporae]|uniref:indolepyruvate ferredoxin oxidoreductase family protein n=1 Tax=Coralliovum pocilloporae TaxID=3066369 RepID=UPI00330735AC
MNAFAKRITLDDKYARENGSVYLTGIQALVRVALDRARLDRLAGLHTGGFISGYRGSPLGGFDQQLEAAQAHLDELDIVFQPGVNEELGATAVWGSQKVGEAGAGSDYDGVFGIWYGKAPGVDRASDALKHANVSGSSAKGGALAICGDDHLAKSSTMTCQSEFALMDAEIPVLNPADLQDVLDYGLLGLELSRYSGLWVGLIALADTMDSSGIVSVDPERLAVNLPRAHHDPRLAAKQNRPVRLATRLENEVLVRELRLPAARAFVRANRLDAIRFGSDRPRFGIVATGKAYRDLRQALEVLGIGHARAVELGIGLYKVAMPWPLENVSFSNFARGLDRLMVVEHKRALMEPQIKDIAYHWSADERPQIWGKATPDGAPFMPSIRDLSVAELVPALLGFMPELARDDAIRSVAQRIEEQAVWADAHQDTAKRTPYFCSGCPHNSSTVVPEGARAMPGIGCHAMAELSGRVTDGLVAMGGEGVHWVGQAPFERDGHAFVNLGDGTYYHSGILAIRQSVAARVPVTYKVLFNDAVAMTGGQAHDGPLSVEQITRQVSAEGVEKICVVSEEPERFTGSSLLAPNVPVHDRDELALVQADCAAYPGVSVIIYDQTCAAEKRRRRKKGLHDDPPKRLFINPKVCEGCGDCTVQSNCVSLEPLETDHGTKRAINQSSCNKDYSCVKGFCPSFVWVDDAELKRSDKGDGLDIAALAADLPRIRERELKETVNLLITGIGGMGVTTVAAVLAMAAHVDGVNVSTLDMTGLAQKGGPVTSQIRFGGKGASIQGPRIPVASLDILLASDLLVAGSAETLMLLNDEKTVAVANGHVTPTAEFTIKQTLSFNEEKLSHTLREATRDLVLHDVAQVAERVLGDAIYTNMLLVGMAYQRGVLPLTLDAVEMAIRLNGAAIDRNIRAFHAGRVLFSRPEALLNEIPVREKPAEMGLDERIAFLGEELTGYQDEAYARRFRDVVERVRRMDEVQPHGGLRITGLVAENLYRLMAYKDEYEVARLYADPAFEEALSAQFSSRSKIRVMLAPPLLSPIDPVSGRPKKRAFGPWVFGAFRLLSRLKGLRGHWYDPFGHTAERKAERALIETYLSDVELILAELDGPVPYGLLAEIARVPDAIRGFGPVKEQVMEKAAKRRLTLLNRLEAERINHEDGPHLMEAAE